jgi:hypothetical protein
MIFRSRTVVAAALGLSLAAPLAARAADPPSPPPMARPATLTSRVVSPNQQLADAVAEAVRRSGRMGQYRIDIAVQDGVAELKGAVADEPQRAEVLKVVRAVPGVVSVVDRLTLQAPITQVQGVAPPPPLPEVPVAQPRAPEAAAAPPNGPIPEPLPVWRPPMPSPYDLNPPPMPPYSWPTYAPYNNYSRVAYPLAYPYQSWPFIGPCYPFPKVPLGWRSVKLEFQDGHWWFSKVATRNDWWRLRYW